MIKYAAALSRDVGDISSSPSTTKLLKADDLPKAGICANFTLGHHFMKTTERGHHCLNVIVALGAGSKLSTTC